MKTQRINSKELLGLLAPVSLLVIAGFVLTGGNGKPTLERVQVIRYPVSSTTFDTHIEVALRYPPQNLNKLFGRSPSWDGSMVKIIDGKGKVVHQMVYTGNHFAERRGATRYILPIRFYWSQLPHSGKVTLKGSIKIDDKWTFPIATTLRD